MAQLVLGLMAAGVLAVVTFLMYKKRKAERPDLEYYDKMSLEGLLKIVKLELSELVKDDDTIMANDINFEAILRNKRRVEVALTDCVYGIDSAKKIVLALIRDILERELRDVQTVTEVMDFSTPAVLPPMVKFEVLLYRLGKKHHSNTINYLETTYKISEERIIDRETMRKGREFDFTTLDNIFALEVEPEPITFSESLDIIAILLYQRYKGFGCIDSLRALKVDGIDFGTSGSIRYEIEGRLDIPYRSVNSVWVQINTKWVHFSFLDFHKAGEVRRIVNQLVAWGTTAPMTEKKAFKVNDMYDGARVTAIRPPAGEFWACFVRKFTLSVYSMKQLLERPVIHNWELPAKLIAFLMEAEETTAFTGQQNTGKTTMMKSAIEYVSNINIRVLEMSFELALREIYPWRNIFTVKPTDYVSSAQLQDTLKKTDGYLSMVGEVAEDIVAARMIQFCLVGSAFTIFSHHGKDDFGLINGLTNSLVASGEYKDHNVAMSTVLDAIKNNVHLSFITNQRVIEYISEIVKEDEVAPYPKLDRSTTVEKAIDQFTAVAREFYTRSTDRVRFTSRHIVKFDRATMTYIPGDWYTPETTARIMNKLSPERQAEFAEFYRENWRKECKV